MTLRGQPKDRSIESLTGFQTTGAIQTDAAINSGNSGGPLLDGAGRVLGINSQIQTKNGDGSGVGFAVPVEAVKRSLTQLRQGGKVHYAYLGLSSRELYPQLAAHFKLGVKQGVWVQTVESGGPADKAGIEAGSDQQRFQEDRWAVGGDVLVAVDGKPLHHDDDLSRLLDPKRPGGTVALGVVRDGKRRTVRVTLGERPLNDPPPGG